MPLTVARSGLSRVTLPQFLAVALALRLAALALPSVAHPDEVFQYLEPAHRLLSGTGVVTWEWRSGMRSWLIPLLAAGPMALGQALAPATVLAAKLPGLLAVLASLVVVPVAWLLGARLSRLHAVVCAAVAAAWYEFVWFAPHMMSETLSVYAILPAAAILVAPERWSGRRLAVAGALLGFAATLRFQHAPAVAVLAIATAGRRREVWPPLILGGVAGLLPSALADGAMGAVPFRWLVENVRLNVVAGRAALYGVSGPWGLVWELRWNWSAWAVPLLLLAGVGARRYPALGWTALANFAFHSAIAHKEYRFVLLSVALAVLLAAIGTVDAVRWVARRNGDGREHAWLRVALLAWVLASASLAFGGFRKQWSSFSPELTLASRLRADPALCGVAIYRRNFSRTGGYTWLGRDVPMLYVTDDDPAARATLARSSAAANYVMATRGRAGELPPGYTVAGCLADDGGPLCLYRRAGRCDARAGRADGINAVLARRDD